MENFDYVKNNYGLSSVTTTSPLIAKFIKANCPDVAFDSHLVMVGSESEKEFFAYSMPRRFT